MDFARWVDEKQKQSDETVTLAIARIEAATRVSSISIRRAYRGSRVNVDVARRLAAITEGAVSVAELLDRPTERELRAMKPPAKRGRPKRASSPGTEQAVAKASAAA